MRWRAWIKKWTRRFLPVVVLGLGVVAFLVLVSTKPELAQREVTEKVWPVRTVAGTVETLQPKLRFFGEIVAGREVELRPLVSGSVIEVGPAFQDGGRVSKGDLLVAIDPFDYDAAVAETTADLAEARARLRELEAEGQAAAAMLEQEITAETLHERDLNRFKSLNARGAASTKAFDDARMALLTASEQVIERRFAIERLDASLARQRAVIQKLQVKAERAGRDLEQTRLTAPFAGYLTDIGTEVGKRLSQNDRVARLIDSRRLEVRFTVGMRQFGELLQGGDLIGRTAEVTWHLRDQAHRYTATVTRTGSEIDAASGGIAVFATVESGESLDLLRPGAFVEIALPGPRYEAVTRLPETAWFDGRIMIVADGRLQARPADLVRHLGNDILIRSDLKGGEAVLVTPIPGADTGLSVTIVGEDG
ncbi:MAG: HlyD family efflux transporter periplasmic adaptor subunit [Alphaproteobacteria bacterium]|nr:HlyD family efflux transporter periplasmic adaptor subunit [Alphaproteobacteria bacterium]MCB9930777.1 HlyD family efflux transporter periplasmic adaptor subunit [Alphaproteobacteria bacterium]